MKIGDNVRMLHGSESGKVVRIIDNQLLEVEIEDGFRIPVLKSELVIIHQDEKDYFESSSQGSSVIHEKKTSPKKSDSLEVKDLCIAVSELNDHIRSFYLINNSSYDITYTISEELVSASLQPLSFGILERNNSIKFTERSLQEIEHWKSILLQITYFSNQNYSYKAPDVFRFQVKGKALTKKADYISSIDKQGIVFSLKERKQATIDTEQIKEMMFESDVPEIGKSSLKASTSHDSIDLHIEALNENWANLPKEELLSIQLQAFENALDRAISDGMDHITFIHGVGNGVLKNNIHKSLSGHPHVQYFKDAQKEKFGYGATYVKIK